MTQKEKLLHDNREQEQMTYRQIADKDEEIEQLRQQKQQLEHEKQQLPLKQVAPGAVALKLFFHRFQAVELIIDSGKFLRVMRAEILTAGLFGNGFQRFFIEIRPAGGKTHAERPAPPTGDGADADGIDL